MAVFCLKHTAQQISALNIAIICLLAGCESKITPDVTSSAAAVRINDPEPTADGVNLSWDKARGAESYAVTIASDVGCSQVLTKKSVSATSTVIEASIGTSFFVCIQPLDGAGQPLSRRPPRGIAVSYTAVVATKFLSADCLDPDLSQVQVGQKLSLCNGSVAEGTAAVPDLGNLSAGNVRSGVTIAGITGSYTGGGVACSSSGQTGCLATQSYPSIDSTLVSSYNLRSTSVAGNGKLKYCRSGYNLSVMDLPNAYANMGFFGRAFTASAATDELTVTAKTFMQALGSVPVKVSTTGTLPGGLSSGATYYTIWVTNTTIKLATSIENANAGIGIDLSSVGSGTHRINTVGDGVAQHWDVTDDTNSSGGSRATWYTNSFFGQNYLCSASDWQILAPSTNGTSITPGTASDCDAGSDDCMIQDKLTGQVWTEVNPGGGGAGLTWAGAISFCNNLDFGGFSDWRLPIHEEFLQANIDGLYMFEMDYPSSGASNVFFRTATLNAVSWNNSDNQAMWVHGNGGSQAENQHNTTQYGATYALRCVRN